MKTRFLSGFLAVVGGGAAIVGCFEPTNKVKADAPRVVTAPPAPTQTQPLAQQPVAPPSNTSTPAVASVPTDLSPAISEVAKLYQSNVSEDVLLAYINNYGQAFNPTADEILYLNDLGVSDNVVTALVKHQGNGTQPTQNVAAAPAPAPAPPAPAPQQQSQAVTAPLVPQQEAAAAVTAAPAQPVTVNYFYDTLSPYGTWVETDYGRCWRPAVVVANPTWRPYCDRGHWIYTDSGWYWASDYSWGWATFHYGRWCSDVRFGWVWVPDTCWGPSWVSWRYTSDYCGWAPLPPAACYRPGFGFTYHSAGVSVSFDFGLAESCYTFVPTHRFCDPHPYRYVAPRNTTTIIYKNSTVVNNYIVNKNSTTIINEGVGRKHIETVTKQPIQKVAIHEWPANSSAITTPDRIHKVGKDMVVYKPAAPEVVRPKFTAIKSETVVVNSNGSAHGRPGAGWTGNRTSIAVQETTTPAPRTQHNSAVRSNDSLFAPKVATQQATEAQAPRATPRYQTPSDLGNSNVGHSRHENQPKVVSASESQQVKVPSEPWRNYQSPARTETPAAPTARTAPLVPENNNLNNIYRDNSRFESPRNARAEGTATPSYSTPGASEYGHSRGGIRSESAPATPRQYQSPGNSHHGSESASRVSPGYQRSEGNGKFADRDSSGPGNGQGGGRGRY